MRYFIFIISLTFGMQISLAQNLLPTPITISTIPDTPKPGEVFIIKANSLSVDLGKSDISWSINGNGVGRAFGQKEIKTSMPYGNQVILIEVNIKSVSGETFYAKKTISPKRLILITEAADSYVPYWYAGKAEVARGGYAKIYAYTEIYSGNKRLKPSEMVYSWSVRDEPILEQSGVGRDTLTYRMLDEYGDNVPVSVSVSPIENSEEVIENTTIRTFNPEIIMFLGDESGEAVSRAAIVGQKNISSKAFSIISEPFFFSTDYTKNKNLVYIWEVNDLAQTDNSNSVRFFKLPEGTSGNVTITSKIEHVNRIFQTASSRIRLSF
jgi:hypothetical protein